jgi:hypothetical protein
MTSVLGLLPYRDVDGKSLTILYNQKFRFLLPRSPDFLYQLLEW